VEHNIEGCALIIGGQSEKAVEELPLLRCTGCTYAWQLRNVKPNATTRENIENACCTHAAAKSRIGMAAARIGTDLDAENGRKESCTPANEKRQSRPDICAET